MASSVDGSPSRTTVSRVIVIALLLGIAGVASAAGDPAAGKTKSATCASCHGTDGNSANPLWPKLAGQHAGYLERQLADFKAEKRTDPTMSPMVAALSKEDMADLAAYFATQKIQRGTASAELVDQGERIYRGGIPGRAVAACAACHGPAGSGNPPAGFPALGGQHAAYTEKTLKDFRSGTRHNDLNRMMRDIAGKMTDDEIEAVADYIAGLH